MYPTRNARLALLAVILSIGAAAEAELGGSAASVRTDSGRMGARIASQAVRNFARHDLTRGNGGQVHEFTNASGQVFAVTWAGPGKPDLRSLLGRYFATFQTASGVGARGRHALRRPTQVAQADLQIQTAGHMGVFRGVAFIPSLAPAGFVPADLPSPE